MNSQVVMPWMTLAFCILALVIHLAVEEARAPILLGYHRPLVLEGEGWRLITAHLTHYSTRHFIANLLAFAGLGIAVESRAGHVAFAKLWFFVALFISAVLMLFVPEMERYAGISGINYGLMMFLGMQLLRGKKRVLGLPPHVVFAALLVSSGLLLWEQALSGSSVFSGDMQGLRVAWQAHLAGMSAAALFAAQRDDGFCFPWARR